MSLNVARPRTLEELLFEIIRRVFETLKDEDLLEQMGPRVQRELLLAYARTSISFNETRSRASERGGPAEGRPPGRAARGARAQARLSRKTTDSLATRPRSLPTRTPMSSTTSCASSASSSAANMPPPTGWTPLRRRRPRREPEEHWHGKLVVVIDELDKLTASDQGMQCIQHSSAG